ncbi:MAG: hypothetical protein ACOCZH_02980, partial [Phototrophicaceae bacterium]
LASRLRRSLPVPWLWSDGHLLTDAAHDAVETALTLDILKANQPEPFAAILDLEPLPGWQPAAATIAAYIMRFRLRELLGDMQAEVSRMVTRIQNATTEREVRPFPWDVSGQPALSLTIVSRLIYYQNAQIYAGKSSDTKAAAERLEGLWAVNTLTGQRGEISGVLGPVEAHREALLEQFTDPLTLDIVRHAPDDDYVVRLDVDGGDQLSIASALRLMVRLQHLNRFDVKPRQAIQALQMKPSLRAQIVRAASDVAKKAGLLANAYNSREVPERFIMAGAGQIDPDEAEPTGFEINLRFGGDRIRAYNPESLPYDFTHCGVYRLRPQFQNQPIRVCVVNTLTFKIEDFIEALNRQLERHFDFAIEVVRERQVRVLSRSNLESAVRVVEKENPDIILAFFPNELDINEDEDSGEEATAAYIQSLTLGRGLPTHIIFQATLDDPEAMPSIIMAILGKTGSAPFVLAEPLPADFVIGLDAVRQQRATADTRLTAISRVYKADGEFVRYALRDLTLPDDTPPYVLARDLFPQREFAGKRVVIHHHGPFDPGLLAALDRWFQAINAVLWPVEINSTGAPRLYAIDKGVIQPPWGSAFTFGPHEALLVSAIPREDVTPQPLRVRVVDLGGPPLDIAEAVRGVLVWSLLAYGAERLPRLPVSVVRAESIAYWLRRGGTFGAEQGEVPFWL